MNLVNLMLSFGVKEQRENNERGFWERLRAGKGWRAAREKDDLLAGKAVRLHRVGRSDGGPRFPSQQASRWAEGCCPGRGGGGRAWKTPGRLSRRCGDNVIVEDISVVVLGGI